MHNDSILAAATRAWGEDFQFSMVCEECSELILAIHHYRRGRCTIEELISEVADVQNVCRQAAIILGEQAVADAADMKMQRLKERITLNNPNWESEE